MILSLMVLSQLSPPPLVPLEASRDRVWAPMVATEEMPQPQAVKPPLPRNAILFSPASTGALFVSLEYERQIALQWTLFAAAGGGAFGQAGGDLGVRLYPVDHAFESWFADARFSAFGLFSGLLMMGPMVELGYSWRIGNRWLLSAGAGAAMWLSVIRSLGARLPFGATSFANVFVLPGLYEPPPGQVGVQPSIRFTIGPTF